jgi:hypothetical protein
LQTKSTGILSPKIKLLEISMDEQLGQARALIKAGHYSEARAILNKLDHPTARKWLQQLDQITPALPDQEMRTLTNRILVVLGGVTVALTLLVALYAAFLRPVGVAQADLVIVQNTITDMKSTVATVQKDVTETKAALGTQASDVDKKLATIETDMAGSASDSQVWEYLLFQYRQQNSCFLWNMTGNDCTMEFVNTNDPAYDASLWGVSKCNLTFDKTNGECLIKEFRGMIFYLNRLGDERWEMVNVIDKSTSTSYSTEIYFKRIKQTDIKDSSST